MVLAAGARGSAAADRPLQRLCRAYWPPLYAYVRRRVADVHEAQDLTQACFEKPLEKLLAQADSARGRFRAFLITSFKHFLSQEWEKARAGKRGGGRAHLSLDFASQESTCAALTDTFTAERLFERQWAITLLNRVVHRLKREMERGSKGLQFRLLKDFIGGAGNSSYASVAAASGVSPSAARKAASRMRDHYRRLLREEIAQTVSTAVEIDEKVRHLFATFAD